MNKIIQFGEHVEGYDIPVLNEREIRASAGILFLVMFTALMLIMFRQNFVPVKYVIIVFLTDMLIRVFINPKYSPALILGRLIVRNQVPEYVGAKQKKFAWYIGVTFATVMFSLLVVENAWSPITGIICLICLIFLFFEAAFGICLGCIAYSWIYKDKAQYCPGEVCDVKARQEIQKTSPVQMLVLVGLVAYVILAGVLFNDNFSKRPYDLLGISAMMKKK